MKAHIICINILTTILLCFVTFKASADKIDGNFLLKSCKESIAIFEGVTLSSNQAYLAGFCSGKISGFRNSGMYARGFTDGEIEKLWFCIPPEIKAEQMTRIVIKHLQDNPETLHKSAPELLLSLFIKAFPCNKGS